MSRHDRGCENTGHNPVAPFRHQPRLGRCRRRRRSLLRAGGPTKATSSTSSAFVADSQANSSKVRSGTRPRVPCQTAGSRADMPWWAWAVPPGCSTARPPHSWFSTCWKSVGCRACTSGLYGKCKTARQSRSSSRTSLHRVGTERHREDAEMGHGDSEPSCDQGPSPASVFSPCPIAFGTTRRLHRQRVLGDRRTRLGSGLRPDELGRRHR